MELQIIQQIIYEIRGQKVTLDADLAKLYEVETKVLKQAVKRNMARFPPDFLFELSQEEYNSLRSQIVTLKNSGRGKHSKYAAYAFTEQGVAMLSSVLKSKKAIAVNISIMRTFVLIRRFALTYEELSLRIQELEEKFDMHISDINEVLNLLLEERNQKIDWEDRGKIGFKE